MFRRQKRHKQLHILKDIISIALFLILMRFENASGMRATILYVSFGGYFIVNLLKTEHPLRFVAEGIFATILLYYSRFALNLNVILMMSLTLIHAGLVLDIISGLGILIVNYFLLGYNFYNMSLYHVNYERVIEFAFILVLMTLIFALASFLNRFVKQKSALDQLNKKLAQQGESLKEALLSEQDANQRLESAKRDVIRLTRQVERSHIARTLHDDLGHEMTGLIMALEMIKRTGGSEQAEMIEEALVQSRAMLARTRELVVGLDLKGTFNLSERLKDRFATYQNQTGIKVTLENECKQNINVLDEDLKEVLYKTILESLTNTAKHSNAENILIKFYEGDGHLYVEIEDDGTLEKKLEKGNGLRYMMERLSFYDGHADFVVKPELFKIEIKIPLKGERI